MPFEKVKVVSEIYRGRLAAIGIGSSIEGAESGRPGVAMEFVMEDISGNPVDVVSFFMPEAEARHLCDRIAVGLAIAKGEVN